MAREEDESRKPAPWRPFSGLARRQRDFENMFDDLFRLRSPFGRAFSLPVDVDVYEEGDDIIVKAELPGLAKEDIGISIQEHLLTIRGEKKSEEKINQEDYFRSERCYGIFTRVVELPQRVQAEKCKATLENGVLVIRLPKTEEAKNKQISVKIE